MDTLWYGMIVPITWVMLVTASVTPPERLSGIAEGPQPMLPKCFQNASKSTLTACLLPLQIVKFLCVSWLVNFQLRLQCKVSVTFEVSVQFRDQSSYHLFICCSYFFFSRKQNFSFANFTFKCLFVCVFLIKLSLRPFFWHPHVDYKETFLFTTLRTDWGGY